MRKLLALFLILSSPTAFALRAFEPIQIEPTVYNGPAEHWYEQLLKYFERMRVQPKAEDNEALPKFGSCDAFSSQIQKSQTKEKKQQYSGGFMRRNMIMEDSVMEAMPMMAKSENRIMVESESNHSETNVQVAGIDEADIVKTDGKFVYYLKDKVIHIIKAYPAEKLETVSNINLPSDFSARDILINGDQLILLGNNWNEYGFDEPNLRKKRAESMIWPPSRHQYNREKTSVILYDISDKTDPEIDHTLHFDGNYQTVRRIENQLYLVTSENIWDYNIRPMEILPSFQRDSEEAKNLIRCEDARYIPNQNLTQYTSFISVDLKNPDNKPDQEIIFGGTGNTVYMSHKNAYITTPFYESNDGQQTILFKFSLNNGDIDFEDKGKVPGNLLNQFSLDEDNDYLRVATTTRSNGLANHVFVLDENMEQVGEIRDIAPGEKIYSTRFIGKRLYMVTFRTIDPLFVIGLDDPKNPKILGKLKIPGYSDYLHPYDENHLIGFGKDTTESKDKSFALYQGMKVALFDVSDVENPIQKQQIIIGDRGTNSELLSNHKALMWDGERKLIGFPIHLTKIPESEKQNDEMNHAWGKTEFVGAQVYKVSPENGFELIASPTHYTQQALEKMGDYFPEDHASNIQRILYIGDHFYTVSPNMIMATDIDSGKTINNLNLNKSIEYPHRLMPNYPIEPGILR